MKHDEQWWTDGKSGYVFKSSNLSNGRLQCKKKHLRYLIDISVSIYLIDISVSISNWGSSCKSKQSQAWVDRIVTSKAQSSVCCRFLESSVFLRSPKHPKPFLETWFKIFKMIQAYSSKLCLYLQSLISGGCEIFDWIFKRHSYPICHATALRIIRDCNVRLWTLQAHKVMQSHVAAWLEAPDANWIKDDPPWVWQVDHQKKV